MNIEYFLNSMLEKINRAELNLYTKKDSRKGKKGQVDKNKENRL